LTPAEGVKGAGVGLQGSLNDEESSQADTSPQDVEALGSDVVVDDLRGSEGTTEVSSAPRVLRRRRSDSQQRGRRWFHRTVHCLVRSCTIAGRHVDLVPSISFILAVEGRLVGWLSARWSYFYLIVRVVGRREARSRHGRASWSEVKQDKSRGRDFAQGRLTSALAAVDLYARDEGNS